MMQSQIESQRDGSGSMFDNIAERYDLLNRVISLGVDQGWRIRTIEGLELSKGARVLDVATGTGDLAIMAARACADAEVVGLDPSEGMLSVGRAKLIETGLDARVRLVKGSAEELPFPADSFDALTIAFGIRNVPDRPKALSEFARVVRPKGRVAILELSEPPRSGLLSPFVRFHVHTVVPWVGALLSGAKEYRYLQKSIAAFPPASEFVPLMEQCGLRVLSATPLTFGVCHLYLAEPV